MSHEYAMSRVRDALDKSEGNHLKAQRLILGWIEKDHSLLFGLVTPHLQGIISHAVNHASARDARNQEKGAKGAAPEKKKMPKRVDMSGAGDFGAELVRGMKGQPVGFGEATPRGLSKPGKASQKHIDAINKLAGANKGKKK